MRYVRIGLISAAFVAFSFAANAQSMKMLVSWPTTNAPTQVQANDFKELVEKASGGKVSIQQVGPEAVPALEQLQPASAGVFDLILTHGAYHGGSKGLALVADAIGIDPVKRRESGVFSFIDEFYQKNHNLKILALVTQGRDGYHCFMRVPLSAEGDWKARKIRGISTFHGVIEALGGTPVAMPVSETYSAIEKGVVDGSCMPAGGMTGYKLEEVAKYRVAPPFGAVTTFVAMNLRKWNSLSKETQAMLSDAGKQAELNSLEIGDRLIKEEYEKLAKAGVNAQQLNQNKLSLVEKAWAVSIWNLGTQCCGDASKQLRELALKAGLTQ